MDKKGEKMIDLHNYKRRLEKSIERIELSDIPKNDKEMLLKFKDDCLSNNLSAGKIDIYLMHLRRFVNMLKKPIEEANKDDLKRVIGELNQMTNYTEQTKVGFKIAVRKLYKLVRGIEEKGVYPPEVSWISTGLGKNHRLLPEELLTEEETKQIVRCADNLRDKTLLSMLAESGARVSEIGTMAIKQVSFETYGTRLTITGKTGTRKILIVNSTPYIQEWINQHPFNDNSSSFLWNNKQNSNECLCYARISHILKRATKKAGIKKRVYPHLLRHSRATQLAPIMSEAALKQYFGWTQGSKMAGIYVHMSGKDTDEAILRANGIEIKKEKIESNLKPIQCIRCKTINGVTNKFCKICGLPLNKEEAENILLRDVKLNEADDFMDKLFKDPEFQELFKRKIKV